MQIKVIDLDGSVAAQPALKHSTVINARDFAYSTRIIARRKTIQRFIERVGAPPLVNQPEIIFYASADFHHLTAALVSRHTQPLTIIHFDNHTDWVKFPNTFNCGAWVNRALDMPHVKRVITLGVNSDDLQNPERKSANLEALRDGRLEVFPWQHPLSYVKGQYGAGFSHAQKDGYIDWENLSQKNWGKFTIELINRIPTEAVYITIDKDVQGITEATTNWDQGAMPLSHITSLIAALARRFNIVGVDVCGDYSKPGFNDPLRWALAYFDHPKNIHISEETLAINSATNAKLIDCFTKAFA